MRVTVDVGLGVTDGWVGDGVHVAGFVEVGVPIGVGVTITINGGGRNGLRAESGAMKMAAYHTATSPVNPRKTSVSRLSRRAARTGIS